MRSLFTEHPFSSLESVAPRNCLQNPPDAPGCAIGWTNEAEEEDSMSKKRISEVKKEIHTLYGLDIEYPEIAKMCRKLGIEFKEDSKFGIHYNAVIEDTAADQIVAGFKSKSSSNQSASPKQTKSVPETTKTPMTEKPAQASVSSSQAPKSAQQASQAVHQSEKRHDQNLQTTHSGNQGQQAQQRQGQANAQQQYNRPQGQQRQGQAPGQQQQYNRPQGQAPGQQQQYNRPQGQAPGQQQQYNRPQGQAPGQQQQYNRPQGQAPGQQQQYNRPQGQAPGQQQQYNRPQGQAPGQQQQYNRPQGQQQRQGQAPGQQQQYNRPQGQSGYRPSGGQPQNRQGAGAPGNSGPNQQRKSKTQMRQEKRRERQQFQERVEQVEPQEKIVELHQNITVSQLAEKMGISASEVIKALFMKGVITTINHVLELETAEMVAHELGYEVLMPSANKATKTAHPHVQVVPPPPNEDPARLKPRPPIVTIMGHVDHGKTSLLDYIRKTRVTDAEVGGITQRIGAYLVQVDEKPIVFLDTPGHEAFTAMRARGAHVTDMAILVVAADDGIMPQTIEAINHARAAKVQIIVAINKMDKPGADPEKVKQQLTEYDLVPEEWGGDTVIVPVSAKSGDGVDDLLEMILLVAELMELKANPEKAASGIVIESKLDKGRGAVGTVLIQAGTLKAGDAFVVGTVWGKVRAMTNDRGKHIKKAGPSIPVEILGFQDVPEAGNILQVVKNEKIAKAQASENAEKQETDSRGRGRINLSNLYENVKEGKLKELNIVLKADIHGSVDAIRHSLDRLSDDRIQLHIIHAATGEISEYDIMLASASNALVVGFNVKADNNAKRVCEREQIEVRFYDIIYKLIEDIENAMEGLLEPEMVEHTIGEAEIRAVFKVGKQGTAIAGSYIRDGKCERNSRVRVWRNEEVIFTGKISSLKRFKDDAKEVGTGYECGIGVQNFNDLEVGDRLEFYQVVARHEISKA